MEALKAQNRPFPSYHHWDRRSDFTGKPMCACMCESMSVLVCAYVCASTVLHQKTGKRIRSAEAPGHFLSVPCCLLLQPGDLGSVVGRSLDLLGTVVEKRMRGKLLALMGNVNHPLHHILAGQTSSLRSGRLNTLRSQTERHRSFVPAAIKL